MRYAIDFNKIVNQLVPHFLGGRKLILFIQSLVHPLKWLNEQFISWAKETKIEASMTSQIFYFEWYLNRKFGKYFLHEGEIKISNGHKIGVPFYFENAEVDLNVNPVMRKQSEGDQQLLMYREDDTTLESSSSFIVFSPRVNTSLISQDQYDAMLRFYVEKYRLANKTYEISYSNE